MASATADVLAPVDVSLMKRTSASRRRARAAAPPRPPPPVAPPSRAPPPPPLPPRRAVVGVSGGNFLRGLIWGNVAGISQALGAAPPGAPRAPQAGRR